MISKIKVLTICMIMGFSCSREIVGKVRYYILFDWLVLTQLLILLDGLLWRVSKVFLEGRNSTKG